MGVAIARHSFHDAPQGGTHRFSEYSPKPPQKEPFECNCTKSVILRPPTEPRQVQQVISLDEEFNGYRMEFQLCTAYEEGVWCAFRWKGPLEGWVDKVEPDRTHAYFISNVNGVKNHLSIEVVLPGYGPTDCFFGHLYFGNDVDISKLANGHYPSQMVDLSAIGPEQIWAHDCSWGVEGMAVFRECAETDGWKAVKRDMDEITRRIRPYHGNVTSDVHELRQKVEGDAELLLIAERTKTWLANIVTNLRDTELFRCGSEADKIVRQGVEQKKRSQE